MRTYIYIINFVIINFDIIINMLRYMNFYEIYDLYLKFIYVKN